MSFSCLTPASRASSISFVLLVSFVLTELELHVKPLQHLDDFFLLPQFRLRHNFRVLPFYSLMDPKRLSLVGLVERGKRTTESAYLQSSNHLRSLQALKSHYKNAQRSLLSLTVIHLI